MTLTHWVTITNFMGFLPIPRSRIYLGTRIYLLVLKALVSNDLEIISFVMSDASSLIFRSINSLEINPPSDDADTEDYETGGPDCLSRFRVERRDDDGEPHRPGHQRLGVCKNDRMVLVYQRARRGNVNTANQRLDSG